MNVGGRPAVPNCSVIMGVPAPIIIVMSTSPVTSGREDVFVFELVGLGPQLGGPGLGAFGGPTFLGDDRRPRFGLETLTIPRW